MTRSVDDTFRTCVEKNPADLSKGLAHWLSTLPRLIEPTYLLAHLDDGVVWGRWSNKRWHYANQVGGPAIGPSLRLVTLQTLRVFNKNAECFLWRGGKGWQQRWLVDSKQGQTQFVGHIDESYMMWGNQSQKLQNKFTLMADGEEGLQHAIPIPFTQPDNTMRQLALQIRHYVTEDQIGFGRIAVSRLYGLTNRS